MGFYVDLEMPEDCPMCPFANYDMFSTFCGCNIVRGKRWAVKNDKDYAESSTRPDWCPLIEVPEPHGRLGDLDRLEQMFVDIDNATYSGFDGTEPFYSAEDAAQIIRLAPTVIPAEEGGA